MTKRERNENSQQEEEDEQAVNLDENMKREAVKEEMIDISNTIAEEDSQQDKTSE